MIQRLLIAALILVLVSFLRVESTEASALGLADGTYNISLDFPGTTLDATGTISIGPTSVIGFHVDSNPTLGTFDCTGCSIGVDSISGDHVVQNNSFNFIIADATTPHHSLNFLSVVGTAGSVVMVPLDGGDASEGTWRPVPEPSPWVLLFVGTLVIGWRARMRCWAN